MYAKIIEHSESSVTGTNIVTFELEYHRYIHAEMNTHRVFSRNASSSRAIPVNKLIARAKNIECAPVHWGANQPGMQAYEEVSEKSQVIARQVWIQAAYSAAQAASELHGLGVHKQIANRILEPFLNIKVIVTSTEWENFFALRNHHQAQPEIRRLAELMEACLKSSFPKILNPGEWHLPYVLENERETLTLEQQLKVSSARCARVSYNNHDGSQTNVEQDEELYSMLVTRPYTTSKGLKLEVTDPIHCYDEHTEVLTSAGYKYFDEITQDDLIANVDRESGKLEGFNKPLQIISHKHTGKIYEYETPDCSLVVTDGHTLIGQPVSNAKSRHGDLHIAHFKANDPVSAKSHTLDKTKGEQELRMLRAPLVSVNTNTIEYKLGQLYGFYLGDGFISWAQIKFRLVKQRKITYLTNILNSLCIDYSIKEQGYTSKGNLIYCIAIKETRLQDEIITNFGKGAANKFIHQDIIDTNKLAGIFDGLLNSDGHRPKNKLNWSISTTSQKLYESIKNKAALVGMCYTEKVNYKLNQYNLGFPSNTICRVNDSRKAYSKVKIYDVVDKQVYSVHVPGQGLVIRRHGKTLVSGNCSPCEHQATPLPADSSLTSEGVTHISLRGIHSGNFLNWKQHRQLL